MPNRVLGGIFLTIAASIWGGMFVAVKLVVDIIPPIPLVVSLFSSLCGIINGCNL
jgi:drug/metabolite transporter (DMT)-like permease